MDDRRQTEQGEQDDGLTSRDGVASDEVVEDAVGLRASLHASPALTDLGHGGDDRAGLLDEGQMLGTNPPAMAILTCAIAGVGRNAGEGILRLEELDADVGSTELPHILDDDGASLARRVVGLLRDEHGVANGELVVGHDESFSVVEVRRNAKSPRP